MPIFGDTHQFAIEALVETGLLWSPTCSSQLSGRIRVWLRGQALGDLDNWSCWLVPPMSCIVEVAARLEEHWHALLEPLAPEERFDYLDRRFYVAHRDRCLDAGMDDGERMRLFESIDADDAAHPMCDPSFLVNWSEAFDGWKAFLLRPPGKSVQVLWRASGAPAVNVAEFPAQDFAWVVARFASWVENEERAWTEERRSRWPVATLSSLAPQRREGTYAFVRAPVRWDPSGLDLTVVVEDADGVTLVLPEAQARERGWHIELLAACIEVSDVTAFSAVGPATIIVAQLTTHGVPHRLVGGLERLLVFIPVDQVEAAFALMPRA